AQLRDLLLLLGALLARLTDEGFQLGDTVRRRQASRLHGWASPPDQLPGGSLMESGGGSFASMENDLTSCLAFLRPITL
ncbi:MAG TPA: hypothetical protein VIC85_04700, partial [Ktedonobacterales bacterium]